MRDKFSSLFPETRGDLQVVQRDGERPAWVVKDPIQLNYFFFDEHQFWFFSRLDGSRSIADVVEEFNREFFPMTISGQQVMQLCLRLLKDNLLNEAASGQQVLGREAKPSLFAKGVKAMSSALAIRLPSVNARKVIDWLSRWFAWVFAWPTVTCVMVLVGLAATAIWIQFDRLCEEAPRIVTLSGESIVVMLLVLSITKILHELGHAICCRKMGADCSHIGLMFLVFSPCLYCDVTDSWILKSRLKRIWIVLAGIYVEVLIASVAILLWSFCESPRLSTYLLNTAMICSLNTLLVNGNPLMRYDGYFVLSDLLSVPNLSSEARNLAWSRIANWFVASPTSENPRHLANMETVLLTYYCLSAAYRLFVMTAIAWIVYQALDQIHLGQVAVVLSVGYAIVLLGGMLNSMSQFMRAKAKQGRLRLSGILLGISVATASVALMVVPEFEQYVDADAIVEFQTYEYCTAPASGRLRWTCEPESQLGKGDPVFELDDVEMRRKLRKLSHEQRVAKNRLEVLTSAEAITASDQFELPQAAAQFQRLEQQLHQLEMSIQRLTFVAPLAGSVVSVPNSTPNAKSLLDQQLVGSWVEKGELVCLLVGGEAYTAYLLLDEKKLDQVTTGAAVQIVLPGHLDQTIMASVSHIESELKLSNGDVENVIPSGKVRVLLDLKEPIREGVHGLKGKARISIGEMSPLDLVRRFFAESFRFID